MCQKREAREALAQLAPTWIFMSGNPRKIAMYCSDVSGALDKVNSKRRPYKLRSRGFPDAALLVIQFWLYERKTRVAVSG